MLPVCHMDVATEARAPRPRSREADRSHASGPPPWRAFVIVGKGVGESWKKDRGAFARTLYSDPDPMLACSISPHFACYWFALGLFSLSHGRMTASRADARQSLDHERSSCVSLYEWEDASC
jgi:hypothetical protein